MEQTKQCTKCLKEYPETTEYFNRATKDRLRGECKRCLSEIRKERYQQNRQFVLEKVRTYASTPQAIEKRKQRYRENREANLEYASHRHKENREANNKKAQEYYRQNREYMLKRHKEYRDKNKEKLKLRRQTKDYRLKANQRQAANRQSSVERRLSDAVSGAVRRAIKNTGNAKGGRTFNHLPYTPQQLKEHIESQFEPWMTWDNWGHGDGCWQIDHIQPQSLLVFDSLEHSNFQKCWALENLQPLCAVKNVLKSNKVEGCHNPFNKK